MDKESPTQPITSRAPFGLLCIVTTTLLWGSIGLFTKTMPLESLTIAFWRSCFGTLFLALILLLRRRRPHLLLSDLPWMFASGAAVGLAWCCMFLSMRAGTVSLGIMLIYCAPLFVVCLSPLLLGEKLTLGSLVSLIFILFGMVLLCLPGLSGQGSLKKAILWGLLGAFFYAFLPIINKKRQGCSGLAAACLQMISAALVIGFWAWLSNTDLSLPRGSTLAVMGMLGFIHTGLAMWLYFISLQSLKAQHVALISYLEPLSALLWSWIFLGEGLLKSQWLGVGLILGVPLLLEILRRLVGIKRVRALGGTHPTVPPVCEEGACTLELNEE